MGMQIGSQQVSEDVVAEQDATEVVIEGPSAVQAIAGAYNRDIDEPAVAEANLVKEISVEQAATKSQPLASDDENACTTDAVKSQQAARRDLGYGIRRDIGGSIR